MQDGIIEKAIETHENYLKNWNYGLIAKAGTTASPSFWLDAKDGEMSEADAKIYKWISAGSPIETGWYLLKSATKPAVESYPVAAPIVQEKTYFKNKKKAWNYGGIINKLQAPKETGKLNNSDNCWLITSFSIQKEGSYWVVNRSYQYSDEWDTDIYN
jgi:hypothetical protein